MEERIELMKELKIAAYVGTKYPIATKLILDFFKKVNGGEDEQD